MVSLLLEGFVMLHYEQVGFLTSFLKTKISTPAHFQKAIQGVHTDTSFFGHRNASVCISHFISVFIDLSDGLKWVLSVTTAVAQPHRHFQQPKCLPSHTLVGAWGEEQHHKDPQGAFLDGPAPATWMLLPRAMLPGYLHMQHPQLPL